MSFYEDVRDCGEGERGAAGEELEAWERALFSGPSTSRTHNAYGDFDGCDWDGNHGSECDCGAPEGN